MIGLWIRNIQTIAGKDPDFITAILFFLASFTDDELNFEGEAA